MTNTHILKEKERIQLTNKEDENIKISLCSFVFNDFSWIPILLYQLAGSVYFGAIVDHVGVQECTYFYCKNWTVSEMLPNICSCVTVANNSGVRLES